MIWIILGVVLLIGQGALGEGYNFLVVIAALGLMVWGATKLDKK